MKYQISKGYFGEYGWKTISFWRWLWMRSEYVTRVIRKETTGENHAKN